MTRKQVGSKFEGRASGTLRAWISHALMACLLLLIGCTDEEAGQGVQELSPSLDRGAAGAPGMVKSHDKARPSLATSRSGLRTVWVELKQAPALSAARQNKDWSARGQAVYQALKNNANTSQAALRSYLEQKGLNYKAHWIVNAIRVEADEAAIAEIERRSDVARVFDDYAMEIPVPIPGTPQQTVNGVEWNIENVRASEAWEAFGTRGEGIVVANIDTGVEFDHPALVNQYRGTQGEGTYDHNYNWFDPSRICGSPSEEPCDNAGHGTHTMGTIVGDDGGDNQIGVAPGAKWIAAKGCEDFFCSFEALLSAGEWILAPTDLNGQNPRPDLRPHVVNNSWGGSPGDEFYRGIVQAWVAAGIFPVFANGNFGPYCFSSDSPGDYPESYSVGAYDIAEELAFFSGRGPSAFDVIKPNIAAPGVDVRSAVPGGQYAWNSGTSMATPHVTGAVALMWSAALAISGDVDATRVLFDGTAVDREDLECGGEPENNNAWGEGQLDVYEALAIAPIGPTGTLVGVVADTEGQPIAGARVQAVGDEITRSDLSDEAGAFSIRLPVGSYQATATAFGFLAQTQDVVIEEDQTVELQFSLETAPSFALEGTVSDADGEPLADATVTLLGTPLPALSTDETGYFQFPAVPVGEYQLRVSGGGCYVDSDVPVTVSDSDQSLTLTLDFKEDAYGYQCRSVEFEYIEADTPLDLFYIDDDQVQVDLPFPLTLYGETYSTLWVTTNGYLAFASDWPNFFNVSIPDAYLPNAAIYPLWDDLVVFDAVYTTTLGEAPNRQFVIEWRNVGFLEDEYDIAGFEVVLNETGEIIMQYLMADGSLSQGGSATIGLENASGDVAFQYSFNRAAVKSETAVMYEVPFSGFVQGVVTDANDGLGVASATVTATNGEGEVRSVRTNAQGAYRLQLTQGEYTLEVTKSNYVSGSASVVVLEDTTVISDFVLATPLGVISPATLELVLAEDQVRTRNFVLGNLGSADMQFEVREAGGARQRVMRTQHLSASSGHNPFALTTQGRYPNAQPLGQFEPSAPGDVIRSFVPTGLGLAWGVGRAENLWLSDIYSVQNFEFTSEGDPTGRSHPAFWSGYWPADMAFDELRNLVCQLAVGADNGIHCWNTTTGEVEQSITGSPWANISQRGLAHKPVDDTFFVGGWNEGIIYHVAGASYGDAGAVISSCRPPDGTISGLAYNSSMDVLWVATNSFDDVIYELNPYDCTVLATLAPPQGGGFQGAGLELDEEGNLWAIAQSPNLAYLIESGVPSFGDIPWLSVEPIAGSVGIGGEQQVAVTVDTSELEPGLYLGTLFVVTNSGRQPTLRVPVSLVVSGYLHAINCGGDEYVDSAEDAWEADRAYSSGGYGYVERGRVRSTRRDITGTLDPVLLQTQREDPYGYRYDNVPNGTYQIDLGFAELQNVGAGDRMFDVIAEDELLLPAHDIQYEVGRYAADDNRFFVEVSNGQLDVRFVQSVLGRDPVVNSIRVVHRPDR